MSPQAERELDWSIGRQLEQKSDTSSRNGLPATSSAPVAKGALSRSRAIAVAETTVLSQSAEIVAFAKHSQ